MTYTSLKGKSDGASIRALVICGCLLLLPPTTNAAFNSSDLAFIQEIQDAFCTTSLGCSPESGVHSNYSIDRIPILPPFIPSAICCKPCSCNRKSCHLEGTCCPDILDYLPSKAESISTPQIKCKYPQLRDGQYYTMPRAAIAYKMYNKCPKGYGRSNASNKSTSLIASKCERIEDFNDIASKVPVTAKETLIIYQNKYCALCHGVHETELMPWTADVMCKDPGSFLPSSLDALIPELEQRRNDCNILYTPHSVPELYPSQCFFAEIDSCNVTGLWETYDALLESACHAFESVFKMKYRNVFCYLCNIEATGVPFDDGTCSSPFRPPVRVSFSFLLQYEATGTESSADSSNQEEEHEQCTSSQIYDFLTDRCRNVSCPPLWRLVNKECINALEGISGVYYELFVKFEGLASSGGDLEDKDVNLIQKYVDKKMKEFNISTNNYNYAVYMKKSSRHASTSQTNVVRAYVVHITVMSTVDHPVNSTVIDHLLLFHHTDVELQMGSNGLYSYRVTLGIYEVVSGTPSTTRLFDPVGNHTLQMVSAYPGGRLVHVGRSILLTQMYKCPFLDLNTDEFNITHTATGIYSETLQKHWTKDQYITDNGTIRMCMDTYMSVTNEQLHDKSHDTDQNIVVTVKGVLSFVCSSLSILFALISLLTYSLFKSLRTQPGINNMGLLISLIAAQTLFLFGVGQVLDTTSLLCKVLGMLVHYTWLLVTFWTNVCSFHVFRVFKNNTKCDSPAVSTTLYYCLYCCIGSAIPVLINVLVSLAESGFTSDHIGYGGTLCYISSPEMVICVFAVPVAILVVMNIALFGAVVAKLLRTKSMSSRTHANKRRNYLKIYAKLSTLTGMTWLFGILYTFTSVEAFEYAFIILTAAYGIFIFASFLCNARVWQMYKSMVNRRINIKSKTPKSNISPKTLSSNLKNDSSRNSSQNDTPQGSGTIM